jgi:hypothetical protein
LTLEEELAGKLEKHPHFARALKELNILHMSKPMSALKIIFPTTTASLLFRLVTRKRPTCLSEICLNYSSSSPSMKLENWIQVLAFPLRIKSTGYLLM